VGIENCLHLEFTYNSSVYGVDDCVLGSVHFKLVKINLKTMELEVRRKEITTTAPKASPDLQTLYKYEIMDGAPVRGELLPVRLYLSPLELSPTYEQVHNKFSVKYLLNLVLVDSEDRRYFKQHEITLIRRPQGGVGVAPNASVSLVGAASQSASASPEP
jgi:vacuolar protein sorting-associated protein 26